MIYIGGHPDSKVGIGGDSAGGQLTASVAHDVQGLAFQVHTHTDTYTHTYNITHMHGHTNTHTHTYMCIHTQGREWEKEILQ